MGAENLGKSAVTRLDFRKTGAMGPKIYLDFHNFEADFYGNLGRGCHKFTGKTADFGTMYLNLSSSNGDGSNVLRKYSSFFKY